MNTFEVHQLCWAHPHRKLRDLKDSNTLAQEKREHCRNAFERFATLYCEVRETRATPFVLREREEKKVVLMEQFDIIATAHPDDPLKLAKIKKRLRERKEQYFTCVIREGIPTDNNKAERALRHLVLKRKISFGSKTQAGADTLSIIASVLLSLKWR